MLTRRQVALGLAAPALIVPKFSWAQRARTISAPDPGHIFYERPGLASTTPFTDVTGKTPRSVSINPSEKTLIMICAGQSLSTSIIADTFNPVNGAKLDNYCWYDGTLWAATTPLLGCGWSGSVASSVNFNHKIADGIITNGKFDRVWIAPMAMAGTRINLWANDGVLAEATGYYRCIQSAALKLKAQGITTSTPGVKVLIKWNQGVSDTIAGTSQVSYTNSFHKMFSLVAPYLPGAKWMIAKETLINGSVSAAVQAAQVGLVNGTTIFAGENMDDNINASGRTDGTHLNASGGNIAASLGIAAITAITF